MTGQHDQELARRRVPEPGGPVPAAGEDDLSVRAEAGSQHVVLMAQEGVQPFPRDCVPDTGRPVGAGGHKARPSGLNET